MRDVLLEGTFVSLDVESTGFDPERSEIIEIALVRVEGGVITEKFSTLINPGDTIPRRITELTGITYAMVVGKPTFEEVLPKVLSFIGDSVLVAHNAKKDIQFIDKYHRRLYNKRFKPPHICTLNLSRNLLPSLKRHSLQDLADYFGIERAKSHRALEDAVTTAMVFLELLRILWHRLDVRDYLSIKRLSKA